MQTIATKIDNKDFEKFTEICNNNGCSKSEELRKIIQNHIKKNNSNSISNIEDIPEAKNITARIISEEESKTIPKAKVIKISDDDGKTWYDVPDNSDKPVHEVEI